MNDFSIDYAIECNFMDTVYPDNLTYHSHYKYELLLILSDGISAMINSQKYHLNFGTLILLNSNDLHLVLNETSRPFYRLAIHFDPMLIRTYCTMNTNLLSCFQTRENARLLQMDNEDIGQVIELAKSFCPYWHSSRYGEDVLSITYLIQILIMINRLYSTTSTIRPVHFSNLVEKIIAYVDLHLNEDIRIEYIAQKYSYSENYICSQFVKQTGITLKQYILTKKLALAKQYLENNHSVVETSELCGFNNYTNFIRTFKNHVGCSPYKWGKENSTLF